MKHLKRTKNFYFGADRKECRIMKKTGKYGMSAETITLKTIKYIREGYTWNEVAELMSYSKGYLQSLCKAHYKRESSYKALLEMARENAKRQSPVLLKSEKKEELEIVVIETGAILANGVALILNQELETCMPVFCLHELEKIATRDQTAAEALTVIQSTNKLLLMSITRQEEDLFVEPKWVPRNRSRGVVALCCRMWAEGAHIRLITSSGEIERLSLAQGMNNFFVEKIPSRHVKYGAK